MKNIFTKAFVCAGVIASAMALSSVAVFAATDYDYGTVDVSSDLKTKTWEFKSNYPKSNVELKDKDTINGLTMVSAGSSARMRTDSFMPRKSVFTVPVPASSEGTITIVGQGNATDRIVSFTDKGKTVELIDADGNKYSTSGALATFTSDATANGVLQLTVNDKDYKMMKIEVTITDSTNKFAAIKSYIWETPVVPTGLTGTLSWGAEKGKTNTLDYTGDDKKLKDSYINWAVEEMEGYNTATTTDNGSSFKVTVTPTADWFEDKAVWNTVDRAIGKVTLSQPASTVKTGDVLDGYFLATVSNKEAIVYNSGAIRIPKASNASYLEFKTTTPLTVVLTAGSNSSKNNSKICLYKDGTKVTEVDVCGSEKTDVAFYNLSAGTYKIDGGSGSRVVSLYSVDFREPNSIAGTVSKILTEYYCISDTDTYLIHPFSGNPEDYSTISLNGADGKEVLSIEKVYTSVKFSDDTILKASDLGTSYIVAVKVESTNGKAPGEAIVNDKAVLADFSFTNNAVAE